MAKKRKTRSREEAPRERRIAVESDAMNLRQLPDWHIRNGLLHQHQGARQEVLGYFADALSEDRTVMPEAISADAKGCSPGRNR